MGNHRAENRTRSLSSPARSRANQHGALQRGGKRKATRSRSSLSVAKLPVIPTVVGATALGLAGTSAAMDNGMNLTSGPATTAKAKFSSNSIAGALEDRTQAISRDNKRTSATTSAEDQLQEPVDAQAASRVTTLTKLGNQAASRSQEIVKNLGRVPTSGYRLTARFGMSSGLWAHNHTGLDFAAPSGTTIVAIANGTIVSTEYDGAYGNKTVERLDDGTELWYCHQTAFKVSVGDRVTGGEPIGVLGSTGNTTGPHVHVEVRTPDGTPIDPYAAFLAHGVTP